MDIKIVIRLENQKKGLYVIQSHDGWLVSCESCSAYPLHR